MFKKLILPVAFATLLGGCCSAGKCDTAAPARPVAYAAYASTPVKLDGTLDCEAWKSAPVYNLVRPKNWRGYYGELDVDQLGYGEKVLEGATLQMLYDDNNLYLGFNVTDSDIKAKGMEDQLAHFVLGDLIEVFLKPENDSYYWELYSTPRGKKTAYEFVEARKGAEGNDKLQIDFQVYSHVNGTIGDDQPDEGWSTVFVVPFASLAKHGETFKGDGDWTLLIGRYNYMDPQFPKEELTAFPQITNVDFHSLDEYAAIYFLGRD